MKPNFTYLILLLAGIFMRNNLHGQEHCATMPRLDSLFEKNAGLRKNFEEKRSDFNLRLAERKALSARANDAEITYTIPVVFHIVLQDPSVVTDEQVAAQLAQLNQAFSGNSADTNNIPSWFKPLFAKSKIQFCLAQRTPEGIPASGITRTVTSNSSFTYDDNVKYSASGGYDSWNTDAYYNVWICRLGSSLLGYSSFPGDGAAAAQGVVIDYRSLPGGSYTNYNTGKTLSHETGHYFNLYHIWGDDDGACTGTDYVDDTPNQSNASSGCSSGIKTDRCTTGGNGILYQDYMDYSYDACLLMFTAGQVERMEYALLTYRSTLLLSEGCSPVTVYNYDAAIRAVYQPAQRLCNNSYAPALTVRNEGAATLNNLTISVLINGETAHSYDWSGTLVSWDTLLIQLPAYTIAEGNYTIGLTLSSPNNQPDEKEENNTWFSSLLYFAPLAEVQEGFEEDASLPEGWDILSAESAGWQKANGIAASGSASMSKTSDLPGTYQWLRMPQTSLSAVDSAYLSFKIAAAPLSANSSLLDTLEVLLSQDCGVTYQSVYKKYGPGLYSVSAATTSFAPSGTQWRTDTVNLLSYINQGQLHLAFRVSNHNQTTLFLDDINLFSVTVNPNLKMKGFMVTPNPTSGMITVQFYPTPDKLKAVQVYSTTGQLIKNISTGNGVNNLYHINLQSYAPGLYIVRAIFNDGIAIRKIIRN